MTNKTSGLGDNFYIGGFDLSGDVSSLDQISTPLATFDVTGIKKFATERIPGARDGNLQFTSFFNPSPGQAHQALLSLPRTDAIATYFRGTALLSPAFCINGKQINYDFTRDNTAHLTAKIQVQANAFGAEWGKQLTPGLRTDSAATVGTFIDDNGAGTVFGAQAYVQLIAFSGTSVTVQVNHCTTSGGAYTNLLATSAMTAVGAQRLSVPNSTTVNRFLEVTTVGTFSSAVFAVGFMRNQAAVVF